MQARTSDAAFPSRLGSGGDSYIGLIEVANQHFPGFIELLVDGGSGIGHVVKRVRIQCPDCRIVAYEPLPENAAVLRAEFRGTTSVDVREAALGDKTRTCRFEVPTKSRQGIVHTPWIPGTSAEGAVRRHGLVKTSKLIVKKVLGWDPRPSIPVRMVRLDDDLRVAPDFLKLDLQGGEPEALDGLGDLLRDTKVVKLEVELFARWRKNARRSIDILRDNGFCLFVDDLLFTTPRLTDEFRAALHSMGIEVTREMRLYGPSEPYLHVMGKWRTDRPLPLHDMTPTRELSDLLTAERVTGFQSDIIALNSRYAQQWKSVLSPELLRQAGMLP